jgi:uncharacterized protein (TIGR03435 family)
MSQIAALLSGPRSGRPVVDNTGIAGFFNVELRWTPDLAQLPPGLSPDDVPPVDSSGPSLFTALEEQLGLKLEPMTSDVEVLVIEQAEQPSSNDDPNPPATPTAQPQTSAAAPPAFEVASVRRNTSGAQVSQGPMIYPGGRLVAINITVRLLIANAFGLPPGRVTGGPAWIDVDRFDVEARAPSAASQDQIRAMLRTLLAERFRLASHIEPTERPIFALIRARGDGRLGPRLRPSGPDCAPITPPTGGSALPPPPPNGEPGAVFAGNSRPEPGTSLVAPGSTPSRCGRMFLPGYLAGRQITIGDFAAAVANFARRPTVDRTGLTGYYDLDVTFSPQMAPPADPAAAPEDGPSLFAALEEQLGLRLESDRGIVDLLAIDRVEPPTPN